MPTIARHCPEYKVILWKQMRTIQMRTEAICSEFAIARELATITYIFVTVVVVESRSHVQLFYLMDNRTPGPSALHCLLAFAQIHIH